MTKSVYVLGDILLLLLFLGKWSYFCQVFCFTVQFDEVQPVELFQSRRIKCQYFAIHSLMLKLNLTLL